jgi:hypothetical protein
MHKYQKNKKYLIKNILKYINSDVKLKRKYKYIIQILSTWLSFRKHQELLNSKIH